MRLVLASLHLSWLGGATTYLLTVAPALQRLGHDVTLYSPDPGETADLARERGIRTVDREADLPEVCDALLVQDTVMSLELRERYAAPQVFVSHGAELDLALPPQVDGAVAAAVAMNDRAMDRLKGLAVDVNLARLRQPIDIEVFSPRGPPRDRAEAVLLLGNYLTGPRRALVTDLCSELGLRWSQIGFEGTVMANPVEAISGADIVIGYGRSVLEAMACGRPAYVFDYLGGDGWVTAETYPMLERDGFTGTASGQISRERLRRDLLAYDASMGSVNKALISTHHTVYEHARELAQLFKAVAGTPVERFTVGRELARLVRLQWHADWRTHELWRDLNRQGEALQQQERRAAAAEARAAAAETRVAAAERRVDAVVRTRRWRLAQRLLRPLDSLRAALRAKKPDVITARRLRRRCPKVRYDAASTSAL